MLCRTQGLALSFNGGKDSTVLLHLIRAALATRCETEDGADFTSAAAAGQRDDLSQYCGPGFGGEQGITTFFFDDPSDFPEVVEFTYKMNEIYSLDLVVYKGDFMSGLTQLLLDRPIKAIFLGTRAGDPNASGQETFSPSSPGWPAFMRINPILDWSYHDVWEFLILCKLPYCHLYDLGYTSLGSVEKTVPNMALSRQDGAYAPAHMLHDPRLERAGRVSSSGSSYAGAVVRKDSLFGKTGTLSVGLVIIGDEILSAKVEDANMKFLCKALRKEGCLVERVYFVRDELDAIADAVLTLSEKMDAVLTSGGLGPTMDDVTMRGVAKALGRNIVVSEIMQDKIRSHFADDVTETHLRMAQVPDGPETVLIDHVLQDGRPSPYPLVRCRNIYVLPGVPSVVQQKWPAVKDDLQRLAQELTLGSCVPSSQETSPTSQSQSIPFSSVLLRLRISDEAKVASPMEVICNTFGDQLSIGSYPLTNQSDACGLALSIETKDEAVLEEATAMLKRLLPPDSISSEHRNHYAALHSPAHAPTI